jgi:signal transduction histidine kinase
MQKLRQELRRCYPDWERLHDALTDVAQVHPLQAWFAEVYEANGQKIVASGQPPDLPPLVAETTGPIDRPPYRLIVQRFEEDGYPPLVLRVGSYRQGLDDDIRMLDQARLARSVVILLLAPLGGYVLALRATRPIAWIIATAARLQPAHLDERLPVRGTGDELDQLSQTINGMLDRIAGYLERNRTFVANAAHELRSPLAAIRSSVEVALNRPRSPEEYSTILGEVMEECEYLVNLINRLLILAEGDAGRLGAGRQSTRLDKIVRESLDMFEAVAESQGVHVRCAELYPVLVPGDEFHLRQVVRNLLDNAIKFTRADGQVTVTLRPELGAQRALLTVADEGAGIAPHDLPHIFERFYRGDKSRQRQAGGGGSGLGLSICQSIVEALGGQISVASVPGQGSAFTVTLPALTEADTAPSSATAPSGAPRGACADRPAHDLPAHPGAGEVAAGETGAASLP